MKLSLCITEDTTANSEGDSSGRNYEKISDVLERELLTLYPDSKNYESVEISLTFMNPDGIRALNKEYRDVDEATDVLSFPMLDENQPVGLPELPVLALGDIIICPEEVARLHPELESNEAIYLMIAHSFLHLLGFDHDTDEKQVAMWETQNAIKDKILAAMEAN